MRLLPLAPALCLAFGCAPPPYTPPDSTPVADDGPSIEFTWPLAESTLTGCAVATVTIQNFTLVDFTTNPTPVEGQGHWHILHPAGPSTYDVCTMPYCVAHFEALEGGPVNDFLVAALAGNDHQPIYDENQEPIEAKIPATFVGGECTEGLGSEPYDTGGGDTGADTGGDTGADTGAGA